MEVPLYDNRTHSLKTYFILILLENNRSAIFEVTTYFAFSLPYVSNHLSD